MAEKRDEDYLENLLNSVSGDTKEDVDWFDKELESNSSFGELDFDSLDLDDIDGFELDNKEISEKSNISENYTPTKDTDTVSNDYPLENNQETVNDITNESKTVNSELPKGEDEEDLSDIINLMNTFDNNSEKDLSDNNLISQDELNINDFNLDELFNDNTANNISNETKNSNLKEDLESENNSDIMSLLDDGITTDGNDENNKKDKKVGLFQKLLSVFSKKGKSKKNKSSKTNNEDNNSTKDSEDTTVDNDTSLTEIDVNNILDETGSAVDSLEDLDLGNLGLSDFDSLDFGNIGERNSAKSDLEIEDEKASKKKKDKKEKKEKVKKEKVKKEKKPKEKKEPKIESPTDLSDMLIVKPVYIALLLSLICAVIVGLYFGSKQFNYSVNIKEATKLYVNKEYSKAYDLLVGLDIKSGDKNFYGQAENIMKVEKFYNEFNSLYKVKKYSEALEALIRGIKSYDENVDEARELQTFEITTQSLKKITECLQKYYGLTESDGRITSQITDRVQYSNEIHSKATKVLVE